MVIAMRIRMTLIMMLGGGDAVSEVDVHVTPGRSRKTMMMMITPVMLYMVRRVATITH